MGLPHTLYRFDSKCTKQDIREIARSKSAVFKLF